jgi:2-polyprenyl-3-methyl-5-hydroxy-6-metoxy-1,4-benzoquinol methylase
MKDILFVGDGCGQRTFCANQIGLDAFGFDISEYVVKNNIYNLGERYYVDNIVNLNHQTNYYKLVVIYDVLEHVEEKDLEKALKNVYSLGKNFLFSIPFEGDPNLYADKTHKIFKSKEWWVNELTKAGFIIENAPEHFYFKNQLLIGRKP